MTTFYDCIIKLISRVAQNPFPMAQNLLRYIGFVPVRRADVTSRLHITKMAESQSCLLDNPRSPVQTPRIAVLIPAYNEEKTLGKTLESVISTGIPPEDIYVIDDCSTDQTFTVALAYDVQLIQNKKNLGKAESLKRLIFFQRIHERFDLIAFFDADTIVDPQYFSCILSQVQAHPDAVLYIGQVKSLRHNWLTSSRAFDYTYMHDIYKSAQSKYSVITVGPGCASVYKAQAVKKLDMSNDTLAEDMDWTIQIHRKKLGRTLYVPAAIVHTQDPETVHDYIRQIRRWYTGAWQVIRKHRIPWRMEKIDLELGLLCLEGLIYGLLLSLLPFLLPFLILFHSKWIAAIGLYDLSMFSGLVLYSAIRNRRLDIVLKFPSFYIVRYLNAVVFLESFCRVYLKQEVILRWEKVKRYQIG
jgi:cellulose synthase/poly-beta-1,6-N-acetylglucosamine synthase-like glycosyltransferase